MTKDYRDEPSRFLMVTIISSNNIHMSRLSIEQTRELANDKGGLPSLDRLKSTLFWLSLQQ